MSLRLNNPRNKNRSYLRMDKYTTINIMSKSKSCSGEDFNIYHLSFLFSLAWYLQYTRWTAEVRMAIQGEHTKARRKLLVSGEVGEASEEIPHKLMQVLSAETICMSFA